MSFLRNGVLYRDEPNLKRDVGVIYWDGTMECFGPKEFDVHAEMERGAYQVWNFGPMLLDADGGRVCSDFVMVIDQITETFEEAERG